MLICNGSVHHNPISPCNKMSSSVDVALSRRSESVVNVQSGHGNYSELSIVQKVAKTGTNPNRLRKTEGASHFPLSKCRASQVGGKAKNRQL